MSRNPTLDRIKGLKDKANLEKVIDVKKLKEVEIPDIRMPQVDVNIPVPEHSVPEYYKNGTKVFAALAFALAILTASFFINAKGWIVAGICLVPTVIAGWSVVFSMIRSISEGRYFSEETVLIISSTAAFAVGQYRGGAAIMLGYRLLRLIETVSEDKLDALIDDIDFPLPKKVTLETSNGSKEVSITKIRPGQLIRVGRKSIVPVDGTVIEGVSALDTSHLTGADDTIAVGVGSKVYSGCINVSQELIIKASRSFDRSTAVLLGDKLFNSCTTMSMMEKRARGIGSKFSTACVILGAVTAVIPPVLLKGGWSVWIGRGALVMALSASFPLMEALCAAYISGIALCAYKGIVLSKSSSLEKLAGATTYVFNKTGTLTKPGYRIEHISSKKMSEHELLSVAAAAEQHSDSAVAASICAACPSYEPDNGDFSFEEIPCRGVSALIKGRNILVGNAGLLEEEGIRCEIPRTGNTAVHVAVNRKYCGYIVLSNKIKDNAYDAVEALRAKKVTNLVMLTGDLHSIARKVASALGFDMVKAELKKEDKLSALSYLTETQVKGKYLAYVCCGCEDKELFKTADIGISVGALTSRAAIESADVLILADEIGLVSEAAGDAYDTMKTCTVNAAVYAGAKLLLLTAALSGLGIVPLIAADVAAAAFVTINSWRLLSVKRRNNYE